MTNKKYDSLKGNQNATKQNAATSYIQIRITPEKKAAYIRQSQAEGKNLSEWVQDKLDNDLSKSSGH